jgi:hypothetical protein
MSKLRISRLCLCTFALACGAGEACAENYKKTSAIRALSSDYADCVIKKPKRQVLAKEFLIRDLPIGFLRQKQYSSLTDGDCLIKESESYGGIMMSFPADLYRYALAGALVRKELSSSPFESFSAVPPLLHQPAPIMDETKLPKDAKKAAGAKEEFQSATMAVFMAHYSECVVRDNPTSSHALLIAEVGGAEEKTAFGLLNKSLSDCMPSGNTIRFGKENLRGSLAVAYYRLADAASKLAVPAPEQPNA